VGEHFFTRGARIFTRHAANLLPRRYTLTHMNRWVRLFVLFAAALAAYELFAWRGRSARGSSPAASPAPAFSLLADDGRQVSLAGLRGKVIAVNFWSTWCGPCREEIPDLTRVYAARKSGCFELLGIAEESGEHAEVVSAARKLGINYPVLFDDDAKVGDAFRIPGYPRTYLVDVNGLIQKVFEGAVDRDELDRALAPLLADCSQVTSAR